MWAAKSVDLVLVSAELAISEACLLVSVVQSDQLVNELGMICVPYLTQCLVGKGQRLWLAGTTRFGACEMPLQATPIPAECSSLTTPPLATSIRTLLVLVGMRAPADDMRLPVSV